LSSEERNAALKAIHKALVVGKDDVLAANAKDLEAANKAAEGGRLSQSLVKRLDLGKKGKYEDMLQGILDVRDLEDPSTFNLICEMLMPIIFLRHVPNLLFTADTYDAPFLPIAFMSNMQQSTRPPLAPFWTTTSPCHA
jgi:hypothetical protein